MIDDWIGGPIDEVRLVHVAVAWSMALAVCAAAVLGGPALARRPAWRALERRWAEALPHAGGARSFSTMNDLSTLGSAPMVALAAGVGAALALALGQAPAAVALGLAGVVPGPLGRLLKRLAALERPEVGARAFAAPVTFGSAFPSNHSLMAAAFWPTAAALAAGALPAAAGPVAWAAALLVVGLVGMSRMVLRAHSLVDVLGGWLVGAAIGRACLAHLA